MTRPDDASPAPDGPPMGLTPILVVGDARAAIDFYVAAFNAAELARIAAPGGVGLLHVRLRAFGSTLVFMDDIPAMPGMGGKPRTPAALGGTPVTLHLQVADAQAVWHRAVAAGATVVVPLAVQFWGERYGRLRDPFGHEWAVA